MSILLKLKVQAGKPILRGHAYFWRLIREAGADGAAWSIDDIAGRCNGVRPQIRDFVYRLVRGGYAEVTDRAPGPRGRVLYRLVKRPADPPSLRRDGSPARIRGGQRQMWNAIRRLRQFDAEELRIHASTDDCVVRRSTAEAYILRLAAGGYLAVKEAGRPGKLATWRLRPSFDTGPKPPAILRSRLVFDLNRGEIIGPVIAEEEPS